LAGCLTAVVMLFVLLCAPIWTGWTVTYGLNAKSTPQRVGFLRSDEHKALVEECRWVAQVSRAVIGLD
jgi:hypothetical protein